MIEPKKVYEGLNSLLRNIYPGIIILFPLLIFSNPHLYNNNSWILIVMLYFIIMFISHGFLEGIGLLYLKFQYNKIDNKFFKEININYFDIILKNLALPSYYIYVYFLNHYLNKILNLKPQISFSEYRELQDSNKYKLYYGDHEVYHRINSFMICSDISFYGIIFVLFGIILYCLFLKEYFPNNIYPNNAYCKIIVMYLLLLLILVPFKIFLSISLIYMEIHQLFRNGPLKLKSLIDNYYKKRITFSIINKQKSD